MRRRVAEQKSLVRDVLLRRPWADLSTSDAFETMRAEEVLGWQPKQPGMIPDIDRLSYFKA
jgi:hypothetical protein